MKYVLDSSAALPWVLPEKDSAKATRLRDDARNGVHELLARDIFPAEVFNALLKAERTRRINVGEAKPLYASIGADIPFLHPYLPLRGRAGEIFAGQVKPAIMRKRTIAKSRGCVTHIFQMVLVHAVTRLG